jgi:uncharacterized protein YpbB
MSRLTVRLPETLHQQLESLAAQEAVSLNQYIVYALTRQITLAYTVQPIPDMYVKQQQAAYTALLQSLGSATLREIEAALAEREQVEPEEGLTPEVVQALKNRTRAHNTSAGSS